MASAIQEPIVGCVGAFLGFRQGDGDALSAINQSLSNLIADVTQLQKDLSAQLQAISTQIQMTALLSPVAAVQAYQYSGDLPFDTLWTIQIDLNTVHDVLVGDAVADGNSPGSGPGYLAKLMAPLRYACDTSPQK